MPARRSENLPEVVIVEPKIFCDYRGFFLETYRENTYREWGIPDRFVQDNFGNLMKILVAGCRGMLAHDLVPTLNKSGGI